ncbi:MAG: ABC transporter ATP-binding protein [Thermoplasmatales archaeon]|nr:ABC transporter ATP-binding protein [Thermoplasmatales archaeon]
MRINVNGVAFSYSSTPVLKDINLDLEGNEFVSIIGPNGVGKSTLIHCMNKILTPTEGVVMINGEDIKGIPLKELAKKLAYVPYSGGDAFPLKVVDTVLMGRHPHNKWKSLDSDLDIVYDTLKLLRIEHLAMRQFNELSAGQHQKVMLARGIVQEPRLLLLDEPTANLDIRHQIEVTKLLKELSVAKDMLVVMISHDLNIASKFSDRMILMHEGTIFAVGTPEEVLTEENIRIVYKVDSNVVMHNGRPHVILNDSLGDSSDCVDESPEIGISGTPSVAAS